MSSFAPHRRLNALTGEWVLVSPQRNLRPWQGDFAKVQPPVVSPHDPSCYLCAGNKRSNGTTNPDYKGPFVFANDFPALLPEGETVEATDDPFFTQQPARGEAHVICFSERHDLTFAKLDDAGLVAIVEAWKEQHERLAAKYGWVSIFENKGVMMGCSNPHPHGQVWASDHVPHDILTEDRRQAEYFAEHGSPLLLDYARRELADGERTVAQNDDWICVVPWWAKWPFETLVLPLKPVQSFSALTSELVAGLASIVGELTTRYDNLFQTDFPYSMGWHGALPRKGDQAHWQLHAHYYPPLLRSATVRKFMVGYEMLSEPQRDLTAESAAKMLRDVSNIHHSKEN